MSAPKVKITTRLFDKTGAGGKWTPHNRVRFTPKNLPPKPKAPEVLPFKGTVFSERRPKGFPGTLEQQIKAQLPRLGMQKNKQYEDYVQKVKADCAKISQQHMVGMLKGVGQVLAAPMFNRVDQPGKFSYAKRMQIVGSNIIAQVQTGRISQGHAWPGLNKDYADSKGKWGPNKAYSRNKTLPVSTRFWRKTGDLSRYYHQWLTTVLPELSSPDAFTYKTVDFTRSPPHGKVFQASFKLKYPHINPYYMDFLLRYAFASRKAVIYRGIERRYLFRRGGPHDLRRFLYPEYVRPWASLFAQRMGELNLATIKHRLRTGSAAV